MPAAYVRVTLCQMGRVHYKLLFGLAFIVLHKSKTGRNNVRSFAEMCAEDILLVVSRMPFFILFWCSAQMHGPAGWSTAQQGFHGNQVPSKIQLKNKNEKK